MDTATEAALRAIIQALIQRSETAVLPDAIVQNLYGMCEELSSAGMPADAADVGRLAQAAGQMRNAWLNSR